MTLLIFGNIRVLSEMNKIFKKIEKKEKFLEEMWNWQRKINNLSAVEQVKQNASWSDIYSWWFPVSFLQHFSFNSISNDKFCLTVDRSGNPSRRLYVSFPTTYVRKICWRRPDSKSLDLYSYSVYTVHSLIRFNR